MLNSYAASYFDIALHPMVFYSKICLFSLFLFSSSLLKGQEIEQNIKLLQAAVDSAEAAKRRIALEIEDLKLAAIQRDLQAIGLPKPLTGNEIVLHSAMALEYAEPHEQARWVAHIITPDVLSGTIFRSNDFRPDPKVKTGSAVEEDYFLKYPQPDGTIKYDGFGYDRGHLAPSADFRWSAKALSESYYYSNMSPQLPNFNREVWAAVEDRVRGYVQQNPSSKLFVVTGPVLREGLPKVARARHQVSVPELYWKVAVDPEQLKGIAFVMPNQDIKGPIEQYAVTIDSVERLTGLHFFEKLPDQKQYTLKNQRNLADWFPEYKRGDTEPRAVGTLQKGQINTSIARNWINNSKAIEVVGTVVGARLSRAGNVLINLDKQFPNQVFTVFIRKENLVNFSYDPVTFLQGKVIAVKHKVVGLDGLPAMFLENATQIRVLTAE